MLILVVFLCSFCILIHCVTWWRAEMLFKRCAKVVLVSKAEHGANVLDRMPFIQQIERLLHLHNVIVFHNAHTHIFVNSTPNSFSAALR